MKVELAFTALDAGIIGDTWSTTGRDWTDTKPEVAGRICLGMTRDLSARPGHRLQDLRAYAELGQARRTGCLGDALARATSELSIIAVCV
jgi:hypothetical protein